ncbi:hypothetical protein [Brevibacillus brevis]|uniref:hypothetical protein n=1 Tax=Brevibacillus brevis TaxID=1393 RepID=UPI00165E9097|nr:hypothetical protein [Brevibacillus brevis]
MDKQCTFRTTENVFWDNWGRFVTAFPKGGVYSGIAHCDDDGKVEEVTARSPIYDVYDLVDMNCIEILEIEDAGGERNGNSN